tara:strand:+ start:36 stop:392 length:357 start_codon:yes stop_codon:yes gene_type:complete
MALPKGVLTVTSSAFSITFSGHNLAKKKRIACLLQWPILLGGGKEVLKRLGVIRYVNISLARIAVLEIYWDTLLEKDPSSAHVSMQKGMLSTSFPYPQKDLLCFAGAAFPAYNARVLL